MIIIDCRRTCLWLGLICFLTLLYSENADIIFSKKYWWLMVEPYNIWLKKQFLSVLIKILCFVLHICFKSAIIKRLILSNRWAKFHQISFSGFHWRRPRVYSNGHASLTGFRPICNKITKIISRTKKTLGLYIATEQQGQVVYQVC